jgi:CoA:oxalate CoA-transferase
MRCDAGPLSCYRIIEIGHMLAGPYCGMLLADLGAEVIKVEMGAGDISRRTGHHYLGGHNLYFASLNRNKKSVQLDLSVSEDVATFHRLVATSHGLVTNLRPRAITKLGLTYEALRHHNSRIVCVALTGFGLSGPYSELPAYDYIIQAMAGVAMLAGEPGGPPVRAGYSVVDNTGGMMAALGLMAKLLSGKGGQVDVALYDIMLSQLNYLASALLNAGEEPVRHPAGGHSFFVPAQIFRTSDGHLAVFITHDEFWKLFATELGRSDWLVDERFATMLARSRNRDVVIAAISQELERRPTTEWVARMRPLGLVVAGVATLAAALADPCTLAREMIATLSTPGGPLRVIANPIKIGGYVERYEAPPTLGEHDTLFGETSI